MKKFLLFLGVLSLVSCGAPAAPELPEAPLEEPLTTEPEVVAEGLSIPWELVFLPDGDLLLTERSGQLLRIGEDKTPIEVSGVEHRGEGGLMGLALHPDFEENGWIYLYLMTSEGGALSNRVERYVLEGSELSERTVILEGIPGAVYHDGGRIAFGPDGLLYITTGDASSPDLAQNRDSLAGKILRLEEDGSIPKDNPFGSAVYSYGHRNPQGLTWDDEGRLWATEHGRSGFASGYDEINLIVAGGNYGWPTIPGDETAEGMINPALHSGASSTWAPSGVSYHEGQLLFAGLKGEALYSVTLEGESLSELEAHFQGVYGRLRTVVVGPDGALYFLTNNTDGRGTPQEGDDRIIRLQKGPRSL